MLYDYFQGINNALKANGKYVWIKKTICAPNRTFREQQQEKKDMNLAVCWVLVRKVHVVPQNRKAWGEGDVENISPQSC